MIHSPFIVPLQVAVLSLLLAGPALADDLTLTVQQQLQAQGAYSGPLDGKRSADLTKALKEYQKRHNLPASGVLDRATAKVLDDENGLALPESSAPGKTNGPNGSPTRTPAPTATPPHPLQSPTASARPSPSSPPPIPKQSPTIPPTTPSAIPNQSALPAEELTPPEISPSPPGEGPAFATERVTTFLRNFFEAGESKAAGSQLRFYSFPVNYLDYGKVNSQFVRNQILRTMRKWPRRTYRLLGDVEVSPINETTATAELSVAYTLQRGKQRVSGRKRDRVTLRETKGGALKIVSIKERRD
jgi:peptidoglycan hydrolase-like protein with peptidoglycan-binding domain